MRKKYFPNKAKTSSPGGSAKRGMRFVPKIVNDVEPLPCRNLRDEFDLIVRKAYKHDATEDLLRQLWQKAGTLIVTNPQAKIEDIVRLVMDDYLGPYTLGTA